MLKATLTRDQSGVDGTFGTLTLSNGCGGKLVLSTIELPWKDNARNVSCIPEGDYVLSIGQSAKFGDVYEVRGVPGRSSILVHAGNVAGDTEKGLKSDVEGCILVGMRQGEMDGQKAVLDSKHALKALMAFADGEQIGLSVRWA